MPDFIELLQCSNLYEALHTHWVSPVVQITKTQQSGIIHPSSRSSGSREARIYGQVFLTPELALMTLVLNSSLAEEWALGRPPTWFVRQSLVLSWCLQASDLKVGKRADKAKVSGGCFGLQRPRSQEWKQVLREGGKRPLKDTADKPKHWGLQKRQEGSNQDCIHCVSFAVSSWLVMIF